MLRDRVPILSRRPPISIAGENIYFAFPNGALTYDCVACGSQCCRGHGYNSANSKEIRLQLVRRPFLYLFMEPTGPEAHFTHNCSPHCFFLAADGLCELHGESGRTKPETCRLFPFNHLLTAGPYLIVAPHRGLCPLTVASGTRPDTNSSYGFLHEILAGGISSTVHDAGTPCPNLESLIARERDVTSLAGAAIGAMRLPDFMDTAAQFDAPDLASSATSGLRAADFQRMSCDILQVDHSVIDRPDEHADALIIAAAPSIRCRLIFPEMTSDGYVLKRVTQGTELSNYCLALHVMIRVARESGMREVTWRTLIQTENAAKPLLQLLMMAPVVATWRSDVRIDLSCRARYSKSWVRIVKALLPAGQSDHRNTLGEILQRHTPFEGLERVRFLRFVASRLNGNIVGHDQRTRNDGTKQAVRIRVQRWALDRMDERIARLLASSETRQRLSASLLRGGGGRRKVLIPA